MRERLSEEEKRASRKALYGFFEMYDKTTTQHLSEVSVHQNDGKVLISRDVNICISSPAYGENNGYGQIDIMWEDFPCNLVNYKDMGLFGIYDINYYQMEFRKNSLIIIGGDIDIVLT